MKHKSRFFDKQIRERVNGTKKNIKKVLLWLKNMKFVDGCVVSVPINNNLASWLNKYFAVNHKLPNEVLGLIHERLMDSGKSSYYQISSFTPPDHVMSPPSLAYFLLNDGLPSEKAKAIKFDHGDTLETFKKQAESLFANIIQQLATPRVVIRASKNKHDFDDWDPHPVCISCC